MLTTRGTYVAPAQARDAASIALPTALYEYVAPSLSVAPAASGAVAQWPRTRRSCRSPRRRRPHVMSRAMAPLASTHDRGVALHEPEPALGC